MPPYNSVAVHLLVPIQAAEAEYPVERRVPALAPASIATLVPAGAELYSVILDRTEQTYLRKHALDGSGTKPLSELRFARPEYSLRQYLPPDSVVHALYYYNDAQGKKVLGLFDAAIVAGRNVRANLPLERIGALHEALQHDLSLSRQDVVFHWAGREDVCEQTMRGGSGAFACSEIMRLPGSLLEGNCAVLWRGGERDNPVEGK